MPLGRNNTAPPAAPQVGNTQQLPQTFNKGEKEVVKKVGSLWKSKFADDPNADTFYIRADEFYGQLLFREKETGQYFEVKTLQLKTPTSRSGKALPTGLEYNVTLNLTRASKI